MSTREDLAAARADIRQLQQTVRQLEDRQHPARIRQVRLSRKKGEPTGVFQPIIFQTGNQEDRSEESHVSAEKITDPYVLAFEQDGQWFYVEIGDPTNPEGPIGYEPPGTIPYDPPYKRIDDLTECLCTLRRVFEDNVDVPPEDTDALQDACPMCTDRIDTVTCDGNEGMPAKIYVLITGLLETGRVLAGTPGETVLETELASKFNGLVMEGLPIGLTTGAYDPVTDKLILDPGKTSLYAGCGYEFPVVPYGHLFDPDNGLTDTKMRVAVWYDDLAELWRFYVQGTGTGGTPFLDEGTIFGDPLLPGSAFQVVPTWTEVHYTESIDHPFPLQFPWIADGAKIRISNAEPVQRPAPP